MIRPLDALCCIAICAGLWFPTGGAVASDLASAPLVPSPDCIQTILREDKAVSAADCLADVASFSTTAQTDPRGVDYPLAEVQNDEYRMRIHYTGGNFPDAVTANWPLSIEINYGGSGWFSYLLVLVETRNGSIASGFVQSAGDRCNDRFARWDRFSENGNGVYRRSATPFRLVNPLDETDWRTMSNALLLQDADDDAKRQAMLQMADPPLYADWLPYQELDHCATCCVGEIVVMQSMIGTEIDPGRDYAVLGVVLYPDAIAALARSDKIGDRCFAAGLAAAQQRGAPEGGDGEMLFLYRQSWLEVRDGLLAGCPD
ncbi:MAG: hypothetical protein ACON4I_08230 [Candidatus Puniceispirillaceae bacterium]